MSIYWEQADLLLLVVGTLAALCLPRRKRVLAVLFIALAVAFLAKEYYSMPRPCAADATAFCLPSYGFPSVHAAGAAVVALAAVGCAWFYFLAPAAAFIALSRVAFGVHSLTQVGAGVALGAAVWLVANELLDAWKKRRRRVKQAVSQAVKQAARKQKTRKEKRVVERVAEPLEFETKRQLVHMAFGACVIAIALALGKEAGIAALLACLGAGLVIMQFSARRVRFFFSDWALRVFERRGARGGWGALNFVVGALFALSFSQSPAFGCAVIAILAFGDGFATVVGMAFGRTRAFGSKSFEGFLAFFGAGFAASFFLVGWQAALFYSFVLGFVELVDFKVNDNLLIPICAVLLRQATGV